MNSGCVGMMGRIAVPCHVYLGKHDGTLRLEDADNHRLIET